MRVRVVARVAVRFLLVTAVVTAVAMPPGADALAVREAASHSAGSRDFWANMQALLQSRPVLHRIAARELLTADPASKGIRVTRDADGSHLMAYSPRGAAFGLDTTRLSGTSLRAWWFDPLTGTAIDTGSVPRARSVPFYPPETGDGDAGRPWVLVVDDAARGFGPPGTPLAAPR